MVPEAVSEDGAGRSPLTLLAGTPRGNLPARVPERWLRSPFSRVEGDSTGPRMLSVMKGEGVQVG